MRWHRGPLRTCQSKPPQADTIVCLPAQIIWKGEAAAGGFLAVVHGAHEGAQYRLLKVDHSVLGGVYRKPKQFAGQSIYDIFYLQEAVRYLFRVALSAQSGRWQPATRLSTAVINNVPT